MDSLVFNVDDVALNNDNFRQVIYTNQHSQLVVMSVLLNQDIGEEIHKVDQFIKIVSGTCVVVVNGKMFQGSEGLTLSVPAGVSHNVINIGTTKLKLYTIYSPPNEPAGLVQPNKE